MIPLLSSYYFQQQKVGQKQSENKRKLIQSQKALVKALGAITLPSSVAEWLVG